MINRSNERNLNNIILEFTIYLLFFLFAFNFMNKFNYIFFILTIAVCFYMYIKHMRVGVTWEFIVLIVCFTIYFIIYYYHFSITLHTFLMYWLGPSLAYFIGYNLVDETSSIDINRVLLILVWGLFLHGMLNMVMYFKGGFNGRIKSRYASTGRL